MKRPTRRELDAIAAIGMAAAIGEFIQGQAPEEERAALLPLCELLDTETQRAFTFWPLNFSKTDLAEILKRFDSVKARFLSEPQKMQMLVDYALALLDPHITRMKDGARKDAMNDVIGCLYAIRAYFDPGCEDIDPLSGRAASGWAAA